MSNLPESLRRVLAKLPAQPMAGKSAFIQSFSTQVSGDVTTIWRDGTIYKTSKGKTRQLPSVQPIS